MKNGGKNQSVAFISLFSVYIYIYVYENIWKSSVVLGINYLSYYVRKQHISKPNPNET